MSPLAAREVTECPLSSDGRVCGPVAEIQQHYWEQAREIEGLATEVKRNTEANERQAIESRELRIAIGVTNLTLASKFDPILAELQSRSNPPDPRTVDTDPPPRGEMYTGTFELPVQQKIHSVRRSAARSARITAIPITALATAIITAAITSNVIPAFFKWLAHAFGG